MKTNTHKEIIQAALESTENGYGKIANDWLNTSQGFGVTGHSWLLHMQVHIDAFALLNHDEHFDNNQIAGGLEFVHSEWQLLEEAFDRWNRVNNNLNGNKVHNYSSQMRMDHALKVLSSLAHLLHAAADFYSHTNWVENSKGEEKTFDFLNVKTKRKRFKTPAGTLLYSGKFSLMNELFGYSYNSHGAMNKDNGHSNRSHEVINTGSYKGKTMNDLAKADAIESSKQILAEFGKLVQSRTDGS